MRITLFPAFCFAMLVPTQFACAGPVRFPAEACEQAVKVAAELRLAGKQLHGEYKCTLHTERPDSFVVALRYVGPEVEAGTSNLVGYYAVKRLSGNVHEWSFSDERQGQVVWPRHAN